MSVIAHQRHAIEQLLGTIPAAVRQHHLDLRTRPLEEVVWVDRQPLLWGGVSVGTGINSARSERVGVFILGVPGNEPTGAIQSIDPNVLRTCEAFVLVRPVREEERASHPLRLSVLEAVELLDVVRFDARQEAGIISFTPVPEHTQLYVVC